MDILNKMGCKFNKIGVKIKKHSPEILVITGIVGTVVSGVLACKATTKLSVILDDTKELVDEIHKYSTDEQMQAEQKYGPEDAKKDLTIVYVQTGMKLAKLYIPAVALCAVSIASILTAQNILKKRNLAIVAAYTAVDKGFKNYRANVVERFGDTVDKELRHGVQSRKVENVVVDENGKSKKIKETIGVSEKKIASDYSFFFDESNPYWQKDGSYNKMFLTSMQQYANDQLRSKGFLFLNTVLHSLGMPETREGQLVGWIYNPENPIGDNYVDFGIYETFRTQEHDHLIEQIDGDMPNQEVYERVTLLDFNVDGYVLDMM